MLFDIFQYNNKIAIFNYKPSKINSKKNFSSSGSPVPIEYLPAQNILDSRVRLAVLYQGRPTTTIAVGDPLTFRLETQQGYNLLTDIFATNIIAKDPYSGRSVQLIDRFGLVFCIYFIKPMVLRVKFITQNLFWN